MSNDRTTYLTLEDLYRHGDFIVTNTGSETIVDLTVRISGCTLYGTGPSLLIAVQDLWYQLEEHLDAVQHIEDLGINPADLGRLVDAPGRYDSRMDSDLHSVLPFQIEQPVAAAAAEPFDNDSPGYVWALLLPVREGRA